MSGRKVWVADEVLSAEDLNEYLMDQSVMAFSSSAARAGAILTPVNGMVSYREDASIYEFFNGSAWVALGTAIGTVPNATTAANASKVSNQTVFIQSTTPTANATNDLWFW
jgi:hypothetical protein